MWYSKQNSDTYRVQNRGKLYRTLVQCTEQWYSAQNCCTVHSEQYICWEAGSVSGFIAIMSFTTCKPRIRVWCIWRKSGINKCCTYGLVLKQESVVPQVKNNSDKVLFLFTCFWKGSQIQQMAIPSKIFMKGSLVFQAGTAKNVSLS